MPWNETGRQKYAASGARYVGDLADAEFALVEPLLPAGKPRGRKPTDARIILNALCYMVRTGCPWRYLPKDFPPFTTVQNRFYAWRDSGLWEQIVSVLVMTVREAEGKSAVPSVVIVDSQTVKTTEAGGTRGYDTAKATKGRKRHIAVDTLGLPITGKCRQRFLIDKNGWIDAMASGHKTGGRQKGTEVAPVSWTPDYLCSRSPRWARQDEPIHLSSVARWWN